MDWIYVVFNSTFIGICGFLRFSLYVATTIIVIDNVLFGKTGPINRHVIAWYQFVTVHSLQFLGFMIFTLQVAKTIVIGDVSVCKTLIKWNLTYQTIL